MSEQAGDITSYTTENKTILDYFLLVGGWLVSCISLVTIGLISYWAIKIPEKSVNNLPIINAIKGDIRVKPTEPGGKSFDEEHLSIYKTIENTANIPEKNDIVLDKTNETFTNLRKEIKLNELDKGDKKDLTSAIEDALRKVVNGNEKKNDQLEATNQQGTFKLYLGSFSSLSQADEFKQFIKRNNDTLFDNNKLKVFDKLEGEKKVFRVELTNIVSEQEAEELCLVLSSIQISCLLLNE